MSAILFIYRFFRASYAVLFVALLAASIVQGSEKKEITIRINALKPTAYFMPKEAFGAGLDGLEEMDPEITYSAQNIKTMATAPYWRLAYRLRTELAIEAWHWNEEGQWSDSAKQQGYWTSSDKSDKPLLKSYGYRLPRRGSTVDQAGNDGYSRLDDGDRTTFWKSNPYLDAHFTGEDNALHPQWIIIDLGRRRHVNGLRLLWGEPYATRYEVQYWDGVDSDSFNKMGNGVWRAFEHGLIKDGHGGNTFLRLADNQVSVRFVRILLQASSGTAPLTHGDPREQLGYAIYELFLGVCDRTTGRLHDRITHSASNTRQTTMTVSSTDPWHRAIDRNTKSIQPGFDRIMASSLNRGNPILTPIPVLYDTPENAAAEIRFLKSRGYPMSQVELGEEPDGQHVIPEHYGALYLQFSKAIHAIDPSLITGGPGFQSEVTGWNTFADEYGERSWMKRFLGYLLSHKRLNDFGFFSFEWYPFDDVCKPPAGQLIQQPLLLQKAFERLDEDGVPHNIPWIISEYGYSSFAAKAEVEMPAALLNAEIVAHFLTLGGNAAYYYGLEPNEPIREIDSCAHPDRLWGNLMMFQQGPDGQSKWILPAYYGGRMLMDDWAAPINAEHQLFHATVYEGDTTNSRVTAYAVRRPDNLWALLILNKGAKPIKLNEVEFDTSDARGYRWKDSFDVIQYSPRQYIWRANGDDGHPIKSNPPVRYHADNGFTSEIILPPMSITVLRGNGI